MVNTMDFKESVYFACATVLVFIRLADSAHESLYSCNFEDVGACGLHVETARVTWTLGGHTTEAGGQGPSADHTWGTATGAYVYSGSSNNTIATPLTPELSTSTFHMPTGEGGLSFYYYLWGTNGNVLNVYTECDDVRAVTWAYGLSDGPMQTWARGEIAVQCPGSLKIIFESVHNTKNSNIAIDDITLQGTPKIATDGSVSMGTPATTDAMLDGTGVSPERPQVMLSTMPTGGVHNQPQETVTLSIALFILALIFMVISVSVHCFIWRKRKRPAVQLRPKQMSVHNSGYACPVHPNHHGGFGPHGGGGKGSQTRRADPTRATDAEKQSLTSSESGIGENGGSLFFLVPSFLRGRSKTVPNKRSIEQYESIEMGSDAEDANSRGKRVLSDKGDKRKQGFLGKARHFTRSNSLPNSPGNDFYESIDLTHVQRPRPLAYQVTNLMSETTLSTNTLVDDGRDHYSSAGSIPSVHSNHLRSPMIYDNLERNSPLLTLPSRRASHGCSSYTPPSPRLNLSGSHCNITSIYNTPSASQCDTASLSSYDMPTAHLDASPSSNPQSNPFFQSLKPSDNYSSFNRHPGPSGGYHLTSTPTSPDGSHCQEYTTHTPKTNVSAAEQNEYHTLDPDTISDASFERSESEDSEMQYQCPQTKTLQTVKSESSHDYEDLD